MNIVIKILWALVILHIVVTWILAIMRGRTARSKKAKQSTMPAPQLGELPSVSVIVPAWNEKGTIEHCIEHLQKIEYPEWEALIMAGGGDGTFAAAQQATHGDGRFRVLERGPEPKNVALSRGIEAAKNNILVLLDADSIVQQDWLSKLVAPLATGASASFGFYLPMKWTWISTEEYMVQIQYHIKQVSVFPGCASVAIRREALNRIGSLTTEAYSWEDWDVYARLVNAGERIVPAPQAKLLSDRPKTLGEFWANNLRAFRTHLAGLWYHRAMVIRHPIWAFYELFFLGYGATLSLAMIAGLIAIVIQPALTATVAIWAALLAVWIFGRRAALSGEVAVYTGEPKWLTWVWAPVILLFVRILATLFSILTVWRQPLFDYKGPRVLPIEQTPSDGALKR